MCPRCLLGGGVEGVEGEADFEILEVIEHGGMGTVYRAWQPSMERTVAVKIIRAEVIGSDPWARERFLNEVRLASYLDHPNIVPIYDTGETDGLPYLLMKLIDGGSLASRAKELTLAKDQADTTGEKRLAGLLATVAHAVHYMHERGVLHRDIKPSNILLDAAGKPYITDFGIAGSMQEQTMRLTLTGDLLGTPGYMAPEVVEKGMTAATVQSDVFSLGMLLYKLIAGRLPFTGVTPAALLRAAANADPPNPTTINRRISPSLATITMRAISSRPEHRFASAAEFAEELERFGRGEPIHSRDISQLGRLVLWMRRHPALATAVGIASASIIVGGTVSFWQWRKSVRANDQLRHELRISTARRLAARANTELERSPRQALLLALESVETTQQVDGTVQPEAEAALYHVLASVGGSLGLAPCQNRSSFAVDEKDGKTVGGRLSGEIDFLWPGAPPSTVAHHRDAVRGLAWTEAGHLMSVGEDGLVCEWLAEPAGLKLLNGSVLNPPKPGHSLCTAVASAGPMLAVAWSELREENRLRDGAYLGAHSPEFAVPEEERAILLVRDTAAGSTHTQVLPFREAAELQISSEGTVMLAVSERREVPALLRRVPGVSPWEMLNLPELVTPVHAATLSSSGHWFALTSGDRHTRLIDLRGDMTLWELGKHVEIPQHVAFSPNARLLSLMTRQGDTLHVHSVRPTKELGWKTYNIAGRHGVQATFTPDSDWLVASGGKRSLYAVSMEGNKPEPATIVPLCGPDSEVRHLHTAKVGSSTHIISSHTDGSTWSWPFADAAATVSPRHIMTVSSRMRWMSLTKDGQKLMLAEAGRLLILPMAELNNPQRNAVNVPLPDWRPNIFGALHSDGRHVLLGELGGPADECPETLLVDVLDGKVVKPQPQTSRLNAAAFGAGGMCWLGTESGLHLAGSTGDAREPITLDATAALRIQSGHGNTAPSVRSMALDPTGGWGAVGTGWEIGTDRRAQGGLIYWTASQATHATENWRSFCPWPAHRQSKITTMSASPDGQWLAVGGSTNELMLLQMHSTNPAAKPTRISLGTSQAHGLAFSPDSQRLAVRTDEGHIVLVTIATMATHWLPQVHEATQALFGRSAEHLLTLDKDGALWSWELNIHRLVEQAKQLVR